MVSKSISTVNDQKCPTIITKLLLDMGKTFSTSKPGS